MNANSKLFFLLTVICLLLATPVGMALFSLSGLEDQYKSLDERFFERLTSGNAGTSELMTMKRDEQAVLQELIADSQLYLGLTLIASFIGLGVFGFYVFKSITSPLAEYRRRMEKLMQGKMEDAAELHIEGIGEISALSSLFNDYVKMVAKIVAQLHEQSERLEL